MHGNVLLYPLLRIRTFEKSISTTIGQYYGVTPVIHDCITLNKRIFFRTRAQVEICLTEVILLKM